MKFKTIQRAVNSFNTSLNGILNYFNLANVTVKYKLLKSFCMPLLGLRRLFNLPYKTHSRYLPLLCNDLPVDLQLCK